MINFNHRKSKDLYSNRYKIIVSVIVILMAVLIARLFVVTIVQNTKWSSLADDQSIKTVYTAAPRGNIYDRNGKTIATSVSMFTVTFSAGGLTTDEINDSALKLINILEENGDEYTDKFPIKIASDGSFYYTYDEEIEEWLSEMNMPSGTTAKKALSILKSRYGISEDTDRYDALDTLINTYNLSIPIDAKTMRYTYTNSKRSFLSKWNIWTTDEIKKGISAEDAFKKLRENYKIDDSLSDADARKIFVVRNEIATNGFIKYIPITVASDVSDETIALIEEASYKGISVSSEYKRYYVNGNFASHILGYLGSISDSETEYYVTERGYNATDLVGKDGIEASFESKLHGTSGVTKLKVNSSGEIVSVLEQTEATKGQDVYLTIDSDLQEAAEEALASQIQSISGKCQSGAVVAVDVETNEVLAMASYPDYDPNIFAKGITTEAWKSVQSSNPRDSLSPAPLYNNATMASVPPGSTFKPITAVTALELGLNPDTYIYDKQYIEIGGHKWGTSAYNLGQGSYGSENIYLGFGHSSNYYFICIGTGKNWGTGESLGYTITIDDILSTAKSFGLGQKTGIEINETITPLASSERKMAAYKQSVWQYLYNNAHSYFPSDIADDYDKLKENLDTISSWIEDNPSYDEIVKKLKKTDMNSDVIETVAERLKYDYFNQAEWSTGDQFNISIGQGDNAYTPLQMATYIAALGNNGVYNRASVVSGVQGEGTVDKSDSQRTIELKDGTISTVLKGMRNVCTMGTLASVFSSYDVPVAGKTGTAENQGIPQPASEVDYIKSNLSSINSAAGTSVTWSQVETKMKELMKEDPDRYPSEDDTVDAALKAVSGYKVTSSMINANKGSYDYYSWTVTLAPYDNPKIAVVTLLIQGGFSSNAAPVNKAVIEKYFELYGSGTYSSKNSTGSTSTNTYTGTNTEQ